MLNMTVKYTNRLTNISNSLVIDNHIQMIHRHSSAGKLCETNSQKSYCWQSDYQAQLLKMVQTTSWLLNGLQVNSKQGWL